MRRVREVLRLRHALGMSDRLIAQSLGIGKTTVGEYVCRAKVIGITWPVPEEIDDAELERRLFTAPSFEEKPKRPPLDWPRLHEELKRRGVTLMLLWLEYRANEPDGFGYSRFCGLYGDWRRSVSATMRQTHAAGEKLFVDFAGDTVAVFDPLTGDTRQAHIFVSALGASNFTYAEARWSVTVRWRPRVRLAGMAALGGGLARPALGECGDVFGQPIDVDDMGIEVVCEPFFEFAMALMAGIGEGFEELAIAPRTTDVLGRAAALGFDQARIKDARFGIDQAFDLDRVLPAIAEVVEILQRLGSDVLEHVAEPGLARIEEVAGPILIWIGRAPSHTARTNLVKVAVGPADRRLQDQMQTIEPDVERHLDAAQDHGLDVVEGDLEASDSGGTHAAILRRSISVAQFHGRSSSSLWMA